ncbi:MAG: hypothetical protein V1866_02255 [archaeon]
MVNINIEIPEELHKKIKLASIVQDTTLKDYIIKVLEKQGDEGLAGSESRRLLKKAKESNKS